MDFKVEFKDSFVNDLEQIVRRIAAHNPDAARNLGNLILDRCESRSGNPGLEGATALRFDTKHKGRKLATSALS